MNDCIFKHDPPRQDCSQCMNPPKPSTTSKPVELKVIEYPKGFRFGNGDDIIVSSEILHEYIQKQVLEGRIHEVVMFTSVDTIAGIPVPSCSTCEGIYDYSRQRLIELEALEGSGIPPAQNKDALQTNNKESRL